MLVVGGYTSDRLTGTWGFLILVVLVDEYPMKLGKVSFMMVLYIFMKIPKSSPGFFYLEIQYYWLVM